MFLNKLPVNWCLELHGCHIVRYRADVTSGYWCKKEKRLAVECIPSWWLMLFFFFLGWRFEYALRVDIWEFDNQEPTVLTIRGEYFRKGPVTIGVPVASAKTAREDGGFGNQKKESS